MDPKELAQRIYDRALKADHVEWKILDDLFKALPCEGRVACWLVISNRVKELYPDPDAVKTMKVIHPHLVGPVLECFGMQVGVPKVIPLKEIRRFGELYGLSVDGIQKKPEDD